jgi:hypothetical protein
MGKRNVEEFQVPNKRRLKIGKEGERKNNLREVSVGLCSSGTAANSLNPLSTRMRRSIRRRCRYSFI